MNRWVLRQIKPLLRSFEPAACRTSSSSSSAASATSTVSPAESVEETRARIFGTHIGDGLRSGRKILRRALVGERLTSYYPPQWFGGDPLLVDVEAERKKAKLQRLSRRGKAPPKKGSGKRSGKK